MTWGDGPTKDEMRELVAELADQVAGLDVAELRYSRGESDLGEVVALLRYLDEAFNATSYPERSDERWLRRARALLSIGRYKGEPALAEPTSPRRLGGRGRLVGRRRRGGCGPHHHQARPGPRAPLEVIAHGGQIRTLGVCAKQL